MDATPDSQDRESPSHFQASPSLHSNSAADAPSPAASPALSPRATSEGESLTSAKVNEDQGGAESALKDAGGEKVTEQSTPPSRPTSLPKVRITFHITTSENR